MRKASCKLTLIYCCIYFLALVLAMGGYYFMTQEKILMEEHGKGGTIITSVYLIYMVVSIPSALKFFNMAVKKLSDSGIDNHEKVKKYTQYSLFRLLVMTVNLFAGIILFYLLNSNSMIYCAGIAAIALVFCKPSEAKMAAELNISKE